MSFTYRNRKPISIITLGAILLASTITPAFAEYNPTTGRFMSRDPNGTPVMLQPNLPYHGGSPVINLSLDSDRQYVDGLNLYQHLRSNPPNNNDPSGTFTANDMLITAGLIGGLYSLANNYAHYGDEGSNWKLAGSFAKGAGMGAFTALGFGWLAGAFASYAGISIGAATTSIGLMTSPSMLGLAIHEYQSADSYADRLMAQIDVGFSALGVLATHVALFKAANPATVSALEKAASRALRSVGRGKGPLHGTKVHTAFKREVAGLGKALKAEVSYKGGRRVSYGTRGSIRVDVVEGPIDRPVAIYDLKTGGAKLTPGRIKQIRSHLPEQCRDIPIVEIRGDRR